ncbi:anthranilate phosphoribosyltransferase [Bacillaceae bacterium]
MFEFLKEIARGKRGARDLTYEQACEAAQKIVSGEATEAQIGAFFIAERMKEETPDEIVAFIETLRKHSRSLIEDGKGIDCAGPYDGRKSSFMATIPAAAVLASAGVPVTLHGAKTLPPKFGVVLEDVLSRLGIECSVGNRERLAERFERDRFVYIATEEYCPPLARLRPLREQIGVRTLLHTAEKYLLLTNAPYMIVGIFHGTVLQKTAEILSRLPLKKAIVIQGIDGSEDVTTDRKSQGLLVENGRTDTFTVDPQELGIFQKLPKERMEAAQQAKEILAVLNGEKTIYRNMVLLNSAIRFWLADTVGSIEEGIELAAFSLDSGKAKKQFEKWLET